MQVQQEFIENFPQHRRVPQEFQ